MPSIKEAFPRLTVEWADLKDIGLSPGEDVGNLEASERHELASWVTARLLEYASTPIGELLPRLRAWQDHQLPPHTLQTRSYNALVRAGIKTWGEVTPLSPAQLSAVRNVGSTSVLDILTSSVELSLSPAPLDQEGPDGDELMPIPALQPDTALESEFEKSTIDDAIVASALGNMAHGERLSVGERNNAIRRMIGQYSRESKRARDAGEPSLGGAQRWVAGVMGVSQTTVARVMKTDEIRQLDPETFGRKADEDGKSIGLSDSFIAEFHPLYTDTPEGKELTRRALVHAIAEGWNRADAREFVKLKAHSHDDIMEQVLASHGPPPRVSKSDDVAIVTYEERDERTSMPTSPTEVEEQVVPGVEETFTGGDLPAELVQGPPHFPLAPLRTIAAWGVRERDARLLEDILHIKPGVGTLPPSLAALWGEVGKVELRKIADEELLAATLNSLAERLLSYLGERQAAVYRRRIVDGLTLAQVGEEFGVSRERIRQLQGKVERRIERTLRSGDFRLLHWRAADLGTALGAAAPLAHDATRDALRRGFQGASQSATVLMRPLLLRLAGPYRESAGWLIRDQAAMDTSDLEAMADEFGIIKLEEVHELLGLRGVRSDFFDAWLDHSGKFRSDGDLLMLWTGSVVDKCVRLLVSRGEPATAETLVALVGEGHNVRGVRARFFEDERLVRVNREDWALRAWGFEEYTGITDEIAQRIRKVGGSIQVGVVADELVRQFKVKRSSVLLYTAAPMFVVEGDRIRLRGDSEPFEVETALRMCPGAFRSSPDTLSLLVAVDSEALRGSGRSMHGPVAAALGVVPGRPRAFRHEQGELSVTWPMTAALGPSLGSIRTLADVVGATEGDKLRLDFEVGHGHVAVERVPGELDNCDDAEAIRLLTGISTDLDRAPVALANAIDAVPADIQRVLMERGDSQLAERLPMPKVDPELDATLSDLARLIRHR
ncbi:MAG: hypothetical protein OXS47_13745 [Chloroflexota bacterium]|nr:hypothetical protein [Chloroflexota bacterium]